MYQDQIPITMMTATDFHSGTMVDQANIDIVLVGDSLAMTVLGHPDTTSVTMDEMIHHTKAVSKALKHSFLLADMPFGSYEESPAIALRNATRFIKEANANAIKLEGGSRVHDQIKLISESGIPVFGHLGLTPQSINSSGGYHTIGKTAVEAKKLMNDVYSLQSAGCCAIVLECVPDKIAELITSNSSVPIIGIGSGSKVNGQVLVYHDVLSMYNHPSPRFCKKFEDLNSAIAKALSCYRDEVVMKKFPEHEHSYRIKKEPLMEFVEYMNGRISM
ncbi:3-methyl-2-oxobutanoate hydroxymethyltransferase [Acrasis kona]|uniref:3-methyl-2-oxobutanoate hydroxymethyltransferase n=1 Tax=Acrasis kona TaxID=1008807 RepID=A0AAW2ZHB2_9EUKA